MLQSIAIQHGTPTIEKLVKRTRTGSEPRRNSTLALLASSRYTMVYSYWCIDNLFYSSCIGSFLIICILFNSSGQTDAWQNNQLGNEPIDEV